MRQQILFFLSAALSLACTPAPVVQDAGPQTLAISDYCELSAEAFCQFYLRCDRVAADNMQACQAMFLQSCNQNYEPIYSALGQQGLLSLSPSGLVACQQHLASVPCDHQLLDLDGPCAGMWQGHVGQSGLCGAGIESFVCNASNSCVVGLDLCGTCQPAATTGEACGDDLRCVYPDSCVDNTCLGGAFPGASCDAEQRCISGASCRNGVCIARQFVGIGEVCDNDHRCQYGSACVSGHCVQQSFLGEACGDLRPCMSGSCDPQTSICVPRLDPGEVCSRHDACRSGQCASSRCTELVSACLTRD